MCEDLQRRLENVSGEITLEHYKSLTYQFCPSTELANFINVQISQVQKSPRGRRYSNEFKHTCLSIYFSGPKMYKNVLVKLFCLPGPQTLQKLLQVTDVSPGLENPNVFSILKLKVDSLKDEDKYCVLCVDEMNIKSNLFYNSSQDNVIGLEDRGIGERIFKPARTATVLMVRGIFSKWKQPLCYFFYNTTCPGMTLKEIIFHAVNKLREIGLFVIVIISDMGANNIQLKNLLSVTPETPYFILDDQKIFFMFDTPHLLKALRNMLMKYNFLIDGNIVSWIYLKKLYDLDKEYPIRGAPKLTDSHISPNNFEKMKVKYASQVFSATVSAALNAYIQLKAIS